MKMFLKGFQELDHAELIKVNGGYATMWAETTNNTAVPNSSYPSVGSYNTGYPNVGSSTGDTTAGSMSSYWNIASTVPAEQVCTNPSDYHCDIIAYNKAVEHGITNPGTGDWNRINVNTIYNDQFASKAENKPIAGSKGYIFYDWASTPGTAKDHMEYYECSADGKTYTVWETNGLDTPVPKTYTYSIDNNGKGGTGSTAVFVQLNN